MSKHTNNSNSVTIENRKAYHDYFVEEQLECGIELKGNEVKSIREGKASIKESWVAIESGQLYIKKMHISAWATANKFDVDETRDKKLLVHKSEIRDLEKKTVQAGYTIIPLKIYFSNGRAKVLIGVCKGKHNWDKRQVERDNQAKRDIARALKER